MTDVVKDIANLVTQDLLRVAKAMAEESAKAQQDAIATMGLTNIRGTVVAVDANNKVQIRRSTSLNDDESPGPADPGFYPVASPGVLPQVGDLVWGFANNGGAVIMGKEASAGYRDIPAVDASVTSVKQGNLDDLSIAEPKLKDNVATSRVIATDAVGNTEVTTNAVGADEITSSGVGSDEVAVNAIGGSEVATSAIGTDEMSTDSVDGDAIQLNAVGNVEISTGGVGGDEVATSAIGTDEIVSNGVGGDEIGSGQVGTDEIVVNGVGDDEIGADQVGGSELKNGAVGTDEIVAGGVGSNEIGFRVIQGVDIKLQAVGHDELSPGAGTDVGNPNHTHSSTPFVRYSKEEREEMLETRSAVRELVSSATTEEVSTLAKGIELALKLHMDYPQMDAYQREERLESEPEWAEGYIDHYFVGRWHGWEPLELLSPEEQEQRRIYEVENGEQLYQMSVREQLAW